MVALLLALALLQAAPEPSIQERIAALQQKMDNAAKTESSSHEEAVKLYKEVLEDAEKLQAADPSNTKDLPSVISAAALHLATLLQPVATEEGCKTVQPAKSYYDSARNNGNAEQKALAGNNLGSLYWRCKMIDDAKKTMSEIPYDELGDRAQRSFYLDNYAQLLELSGEWANAGMTYKAALLNTPTDEAALAAIHNLLTQGKQPISFAADVAELLTEKRQAQMAADLVLFLFNSLEQFPSADCERLMLSLVHAYASGGLTSEEFEKSGQRRLQEATVKHKPIEFLVRELNLAFSKTFVIDAPAAKDPAQSHNTNVVQQTAVPLVPRVDHAISGRFQSPERRSVERIFPSWIAIGGAPFLSRILKSVGDECAHKADVACASNKYSAAWLLDPTNTAAAMELAVLYSAGSIPELLRPWVSHDVAGYYSPNRSVWASFYSEPSQRIAADADEKEKSDRNQIYNLIRKASEANSQPAPTSSSPGAFKLNTPRHGDTVLRGVAPQEAEAVLVSAFGNDRAKCKATGSQDQGPVTLPRPSVATLVEIAGLPLQYAMVATDAATGTFTVPLQHSLTKGDFVCVYQVVDGVLSGKPIGQPVLGVPLFDHMRNYVAAGGFISQSDSGRHFLPRASWNSDISLERWGYDRYQDQSSHPYSAITALVNIYSEARATSIPKATIAQPAAAGLTHVASLEFGGYAPLFTHRMTWRFMDYQRAFFVAPLIKGGIDFFPGHGVEDSLATGARLGVLRLAHSTRFNAPELQSYLDIVYGNSNNLLVDPQTNTTQRPHQVDFTGMLKVPETPFYLGFNTSAGPGAKQTGIFVGARVEFGRLLHPGIAR